MTPKEKAKELVERYEYIGEYVSDIWMGKYIIKQCALICVDEMYKSIEHFYGQDKEVSGYIEEVKQEINKI